MSEAVNFSLPVLQTMIQVVYTDITQLEVDALVCPDDILLTMKGSLSTVFHTAGGPVLRDDADKYTRPQPVGEVMITSAGRLKARHVFRVITFDVDSSQNIEHVLRKVLSRVLTLAHSLGIKRLAMPLLMTGRAGMPRPQALDILLHHVSCHLIAHPSSLREFIVALYSPGSGDHAVLEKQMYVELAPIRAQLALWIEPVKRLNTRIELLQALSEAIPNDSEIDALVNARIEADKADLKKLFGCAEDTISEPDLHTAAPLSIEEFERAEGRLQAHIDDLAGQSTHFIKLQKIERSRLHQLEQLWRRKGDNTPPETITEITEIKLRIEQYSQDIQKTGEQHSVACHDLERLLRRRQKC